MRPPQPSDLDPARIPLALALGLAPGIPPLLISACMTLTTLAALVVVAVFAGLRGATSSWGIALACLVGLLVMLQAYVYPFTAMVLK